MQSLFSVFRRQSSSQSSPRRKSSSANTQLDATPRHLVALPPTITTTTPPDASSDALQVPKARGAMPPPPPRSRQVSSKSIATTRLVSGATVGAAEATYQPLYLALYARPKHPENFHTALHVTSDLVASRAQKYHCKNVLVVRENEAVAATVDEDSKDDAMDGPDESDSTKKVVEIWTYESREVDAANDMWLLARVLVGYIPTSICNISSAAASINDTAAAPPQLDTILSSVHVPTDLASDVPEYNCWTWTGLAIDSLRKEGYLIEDGSITSNGAHGKLKRPTLTSRDTDNWNDIPEGFIGAANGTASGRRKARGTPRVTPKPSTEFADVKIGMPSEEGKKKGETVAEAGTKSWTEILHTSEQWGRKLVDHNRIGVDQVTGRVRTLDLRTGTEL